jgi:hypothetical protein
VEIPSTNSQAPKRYRLVWFLKFGSSLELGAWNLELNNHTSVRLDGLAAWEKISLTSRWFGNPYRLSLITH